MAVTVWLRRAELALDRIQALISCGTLDTSFPCLYHGFLTCDTGVSSIQSMMDRIIIIQSIMDRIIISSINIDIIF